MRRAASSAVSNARERSLWSGVALSRLRASYRLQSVARAKLQRMRRGATPGHNERSGRPPLHVRLMGAVIVTGHWPADARSYLRLGIAAPYRLVFRALCGWHVPHWYYRRRSSGDPALLAVRRRAYRSSGCDTRCGGPALSLVC